MELVTLQWITLFTGLTFMFAQLLISKKHTSHILFAIFCGSVAMSVAQDISGDSIGAYKYLIGMAACATCNCYWLLSRSLFRGENSISVQHLLLAAAIAILIMFNQGYLFASKIDLVHSATSNFAQHALREITMLLSSCILVLSFWEGCRGFSVANPKEKVQRLLFLFTFGGAVAFSKALNAILAGNPVAQEMATTIIILFVLFNTHILILWRFKFALPKTSVKKEHQASMQRHGDEKGSSKATPSTTVTLSTDTLKTGDSNANCLTPTLSPQIDESELSIQVKSLIVDQCLFLQPNLKIADVARKLDVPEYRVSNALRHNLNARNFNQYVNELRIKHAKSLLADSDKRKWPVLVVGLESGFASVGPFTRAFKAITGYTPNQYRQRFIP
ncbi:helix-turn-helix domain-containing protein [Colwellia sp. MEBiC06753]